MKNNFNLAIVYGILTIFTLILFAGIMLAIILRYSSINETNLSSITLIVAIVILFFGGLIGGIKGKTKGWIVGLIIGLSFSFVILLFQWLQFNELFSLKQSIYHLIFILCATVGGILGVNLVVGK